eukprot:1758221-Rhodomonas_salina.1
MLETSSRQLAHAPFAVSDPASQCVRRPLSAERGSGQDDLSRCGSTDAAFSKRRTLSLSLSLSLSLVLTHARLNSRSS